MAAKESGSLAKDAGGSADAAADATKDDATADAAADEELGGLEEDDTKLDGEVTLEAADGATAQVQRAAAALAMTCANTMKGDQDTTKLPLSGVKQKCTLDFVVRYMNKHLENDERLWIKKPVKTNKIAEVTGGQVENAEPAETKISKWDVDFVNEVWDDKTLNGEYEHECLWALIFSANWLQMRRLVQLCCAKAATEIKGKKEEDVIKILGLDPNSEDVKAVLADKKNAEKKEQA